MVSEEDMLGMHFTDANEKEFVSFNIDKTNLPTRSGSLAELFITMDSHTVVHNR